MILGVIGSAGLIASGLFNVAYPSGIGDTIPLVRVIGGSLVPLALGSATTFVFLCVTTLMLLFRIKLTEQIMAPNGP